MSSPLKELLRTSEDPYLGVDLDLARKMASIFWVLGLTVAIVLLPLTPPDVATGGSVWALTGGLLLVCVAAAYSPRAWPSLWRFKLLLASAYLALLATTLIQWLAGGQGAPYQNLLLLPVLFVSAIYPPKVIAVFLLAVAVCRAAPLAYDGADAAAVASVIASVALWVALAGAILILMRTIRAQRLEAARQEQRAREEARLDELTAIGNRRAFEETLVEEIARADRMGTPLTMAMGDIEHFKRINDEFGHLEGDRCLHGVAQAIDSELRTPDRVFRWGGDEFALVLPGTEMEGARTVIERMQAKVAAACRRPDHERVWIHFAAAELQPGMTAKELSEAADLALMAERARRHRLRP